MPKYPRRRHAHRLAVNQVPNHLPTTCVHGSVCIKGVLCSHRRASPDGEKTADPGDFNATDRSNRERAQPSEYLTAMNHFFAQRLIGTESRAIPGCRRRRVQVVPVPRARRPFPPPGRRPRRGRAMVPGRLRAKMPRLIFAQPGCCPTAAQGAACTRRHADDGDARPARGEPFFARPGTEGKVGRRDRVGIVDRFSANPSPPRPSIPNGESDKATREP